MHVRANGSLTGNNNIAILEVYLAQLGLGHPPGESFYCASIFEYFCQINHYCCTVSHTSSSVMFGEHQRWGS